MDDPTHAMNSLKRQRLDMKRNSVAKKARQAILFQFALELLRAKRENGGRLPQNKMTEVVQSMSDNGVQVTRDLMNKQMQKLANQQATLPPVLEVIQHRLRNGGIERRQERLEQGNDVIHCLNDPRVLGAINLNQAEVNEEQRKKARRARGTMRARIDTIANIRQSKGRGEQNGFHGWTTEQLRAYVQYKKVDADAAMPTTVAPLRVRCLEIMGRLSPSVSPHVSDNEEEEAEQVETAVVVAEETINAPGEEQMLLSEVI